MMKNLKNFKWQHYINYFVIILAGIILSGMSMSDSIKSSDLISLEKIVIAILLSLSLSLVVGFLGELSLGHAGFMCVGAYLGGKSAALLEPMLGEGLPVLIITMIIGGLCAAVCGVIIGLPALRLRGDYLAIVTLAFGEIVRSIFENTSEATFGGPPGLKTPRFDKEYLFIVGIAAILICLAVIQNIMRSKHGRAITAIRDSEIAARATGINVTKYKLIVFTVSAFFAGIAGVIYSFSVSKLQTETFTYIYSIDILVMVVLGGMGNVNGSMIAAALITFLEIKLQTYLTGDLAVFQNFLYALILILIVIYNNAPGLKNFREKYNFKNLWSRVIKEKIAPAKDRDDEAQWHRVPTKIDIDETLSVKVQRDVYAPESDVKKGDK